MVPMICFGVGSPNSPVEEVKGADRGRAEERLIRVHGEPQLERAETPGKPRKGRARERRNIFLLFAVLSPRRPDAETLALC